LLCAQGARLLLRFSLALRTRPVDMRRSSGNVRFQATEGPGLAMPHRPCLIAFSVPATGCLPPSHRTMFALFRHIWLNPVVIPRRCVILTTTPTGPAPSDRILSEFRGHRYYRTRRVRRDYRGHRDYRVRRDYARANSH
jgi:hypothetical protein